MILCIFCFYICEIHGTRPTHDRSTKGGFSFLMLLIAFGSVLAYFTRAQASLQVV